MKPTDATTVGNNCSNQCKWKREYNHPFYRHSAWCEYQLKELSYYDGKHTADCLYHKPDSINLRVVGRKQ